MPKVVPSYKSEARARIVEAAKRLFMTKGYRRTTMDDIADSLGVSKGALYLYFRSKIDVLREIQSTNRRLSRRWMEEALARADPAGGLTEQFEEVFHKAVSREQTALYFEILGEASHDEEIRAAIRVDAREDGRSLRKFLAESRRRGLVGWKGDIDVLTFMVIALFQGAVWNISVGLDPARTDTVLREALAGLLAPPRGARPPKRADRVAD